MTTTLSPSGKASKSSYDVAGRITSVAHADGTTVTFEYRADGALARAGNGVTDVAFERDVLGRVVRESSGGHAVDSHFDARGQRYFVESSLGAQMRVEHDALGSVTGLFCGSDARRIGVDATVGFERDLAGLEAARVFGGKVRTEWQRDAGGRPLKRTTRLMDRVPMTLSSQSYQWRGADQIAAIVDATSGATTFAHDERGRLVRQESQTGVLDRAMDIVGNVYRTQTGADRRYGPGGRLLEANGTQYEYDPDGFLVRKVLADGAEWKYSWNGAGQLAEVTRPDGKKVRFEYDVFSRRTRKTVVNADVVEGRRSDWVRWGVLVG